MKAIHEVVEASIGGFRRRDRRDSWLNDYEQQALQKKERANDTFVFSSWKDDLNSEDESNNSTPLKPRGLFAPDTPSTPRTPTIPWTPSTPSSEIRAPMPSPGPLSSPYSTPLAPRSQKKPVKADLFEFDEDSDEERKALLEIKQPVVKTVQPASNAPMNAATPAPETAPIPAPVEVTPAPSPVPMVQDEDIEIWEGPRQLFQLRKEEIVFPIYDSESEEVDILSIDEDHLGQNHPNQMDVSSEPEMPQEDPTSQPQSETEDKVLPIPKPTIPIEIDEENLVPVVRRKRGRSRQHDSQPLRPIDLNVDTPSSAPPHKKLKKQVIRSPIKTRSLLQRRNSAHLPPIMAPIILH